MITEVRDPETYAIIGAAMEVHREKGIGFLEPVYQECMEIELQLRQIPFSRECWIDLHYKGHVLEKKYKCDFVCFGSIILELKACSNFFLSTAHKPSIIYEQRDSNVHS